MGLIVRFTASGRDRSTRMCATVRRIELHVVPLALPRCSVPRRAGLRRRTAGAGRCRAPGSAPGPSRAACDAGRCSRPRTRGILGRRIGLDSVDGTALAEPEQRRVVGRVERSVAFSCSAGCCAPDLVDPRDQLLEVARLVPVARLDLVLLGVEVLLRAGPHRHVLAQLEAAVDAVARRQRRREDQPHLERRPAARAAGTRAGCRACWRRSSAACTPAASVRVSSVRYSRSSCAVLRQVK